MMKNTDKALFKNRIFYSLGVVGPSIIDTFVGSFLTLYATDVLNLDALYFASLLLVPKIVDIIIDFFIMYFVGKTRTKFGMYRPWLLNMVAMVAAMIMMFSVPAFDIGSAAKLVIVVAGYFISSSVCDSLYWIPYTAIPGVMTENPNELVRISSTKTIFDYGFAVLVSALTMPVLLAFGSYRNPEGWIVVAMIYGLISLISSVLCFAFVRTDPELEKKMTRDYCAADIVKDYKSVITNKSFITAAFILFAFNMAMYTYQTVSYYFYIYNLGIENALGYLSIIAAAATIIASIFSGKLQEKYGHRNMLMFGFILMILSSVLMMFTYNFAMMAFSGCIWVAGNTFVNIMLSSMWPLIAAGFDTGKVKTPLNSAIGLSNIIGNSAMILSGLAGSAIISFSKYDSSLPAQSSGTLNIFRYSSPVLSIALCLIILALVTLDKSLPCRCGTISAEKK